MEIDADGIMWFDDPVTKRHELTKTEIAAGRREAKRARAVAKAMRAANRQVQIAARPTALQKSKATRAKLATLVRRQLMQQTRDRLRAERLERLALKKRRKAPPATKPRVPAKQLPKRRIGSHPSTPAQQLSELRAERRRHRELNLEAAARRRELDAPPLPPLPY